MPFGRLVDAFLGRTYTFFVHFAQCAFFGRDFTGASLNPHWNNPPWDLNFPRPALRFALARTGEIIPKATSLHSDHYKAFRELLVSTREKAGLTQAQVARRLGKPQSYVSKSETGERRLDPVELVFLCRALEVSWLDFAAQLEPVVAGAGEGSVSHR